MKFSFEAMIYKVGINPCVEVPLHITTAMSVAKGYIPVKGKIKTHPFTQTLVPVKNAAYRLYVNGPMLKGAAVQLGDTVQFTIEEDSSPPEYPMPEAFKRQLVKNKLMPVFKKLLNMISIYHLKFCFIHSALKGGASGLLVFNSHICTLAHPHINSIPFAMTSPGYSMQL